jgi:ribosomal protein L11 methyltransferase
MKLASLLVVPAALLVSGLVLAQDIKGALKPGGIAILSGLLRSQERQVRAAYQSRGFKVVRRIHRDAWCALVLKRG